VIIIDTCVFSLVFRRKERTRLEQQIVDSIEQMIRDDWPVVILGIVYQELLSGIKPEKRRLELAEALDAFPLILATKDHHRLAASIRGSCRSKGIDAGAIDCLIAATAILEKGKLVTIDKYFQHMTKAVAIPFLELS